MELTPQLLTDEIDFRIAVRGYDRNEVDDFLERVAVAVGQLQTQLTKAVSRAKTAERRVAELEDDRNRLEGNDRRPAAEAEAMAGAKSVDLEAPVERNVEVGETEPVGSKEQAATEEPHAIPVDAAISDDADLNEELKRTLVLAQRTADAAIREAHDQAKSIVDKAYADARSTREESEAQTAQAREEARGRLIAEIAELEALRETMRGDTVVLERYLGTERARVRETIQVLRRLVDDPKSFQADPVPELSAATLPIEADSAIDEPSEPAADRETGPARAEPEVLRAAEKADVDGSGVEEPPDLNEGRSVESAEPVLLDAPASDPVPAPSSDSPTDSAPASLPDPEPESAREAPSAPRATDEPTRHDEIDHGTSEPGGDGPTSSEQQLPKRGGTASESLGQLFDAADANRDWRSAGKARGDQGPHTQPVAAARFEEESDDAFLAELRRAMDDDQPLGPDREH